jgi:glycosyltransferase involved in cell wall biosynthesis
VTDLSIAVGARPADRRPRVALVGPHAQSRGGVAATVRALADVLSDRFDVVVLSTQVDASVARKLRVMASTLRALDRLCRRGDVDLVHVHASPGISFARKAAATAIARRRGVPLVFHVHGGGFRAQLRGCGARGWPGRRVLRWALEGADAVVALTPGWAADLSAFARISRLRVVPNAPELLRVDCDHAPRNGSDTSTILYLGHLYKDKGVYELVDAFARLHADRPRLRLVLAGEGREHQSLVDYSNRLGLNGSVQLPGWVDAEHKAHLLASAACLVLPSYHEGLPLAVLEAMTAGVPVIASAVGGVPEVARDGFEALLVEPRDPVALEQAVARVIDDREFARRLAVAARRRALEEYSTAALGRRVAAIYDELLEGR